MAEESLGKACSYDFREEVMPGSFRETEGAMNRHIQYQTTKGTEADRCPLFCQAWTRLRGDEVSGGDIMNSVSTTLNELFKVYREELGITGRMSKKKIFEVYPQHKEQMDEILGAAGKDFLSVAYTVGNMIPMPSVVNRARGIGSSRDYWDLALKCIYDWYRNNPDLKKSNFDNTTLFLLCGGKETPIKEMAQLLKRFEEWDKFVFYNRMQPFVYAADGKSDAPKEGPFGLPRELWKGHFGGPDLPSESQIGEFFTNAAECIRKRSELIVKALPGSTREEGKSRK